jgi:hypothetical protein
MAVKIQVEVFWVVTPCNVAVGYQRFEGPCCLHLQGEVKRWYRSTTLHGVTTQKQICGFLMSNHNLQVYDVRQLIHFNIILPSMRSLSRGSSVSIVTGYEQGDSALIPGRGRAFSLPRRCVQTGSGAHPAS